MADHSDEQPLSRRAFLQRIRRAALQRDEGDTGDVDSSSGSGGETGAPSASSASSGAGGGGSVGSDRPVTPRSGRSGGAAAAREARRALEDAGVTVVPLSAGEDRLQVQCKRVGEAFGNEEAGLLEPLADRIAWLDLATTSVDDDGLEVVAQMNELQRLYLQNTAVTGEGLSHLTELERLEYLNLYGAPVDDGGLVHLRAITSLRTVYLWQTNVSGEGVERLREERPEISVEFGREPGGP